jgi:hypothetical protein
MPPFSVNNFAINRDSRETEEGRKKHEEESESWKRIE